MKKQLFVSLSILVMAGLVFGASFAPSIFATTPGPNQMVSQDASGNLANQRSYISPHSVSGDGRYIAFTSKASNLTAADTDTNLDVFVKDTQTGAVTLVDVSDTGAKATNADLPAISYDGRYVVFYSGSNLVTGVTGATLYRRDLVSNTTSVVSTDSSGVTHSGLYPDINADGRYITYVRQSSGSPSWQYIVVKDMTSGTLRTVANGTGDSMYPSIDCSGRVITFMSTGSLSADTPSNYNYNYYIYNYYYATVDWSTVTLKYIESGSTFNKHTPQISCNGNSIIYPDSSDYTSNRYVIKKYDRLKNSNVTVSVNSSGQEANLSTMSYTTGSISDDGRYVAFTTQGTNLDSSYGTTYMGGNHDLYVRDTKAGTTHLVSYTALGFQSGLVPVTSGLSNVVSLSADGSAVAYLYATPNASNTNSELISGVHTGQNDVYVSKTGF